MNVTPLAVRMRQIEDSTGKKFQLVPLSQFRRVLSREESDRRFKEAVRSTFNAGECFIRYLKDCNNA